MTRDSAHFLLFHDAEGQWYAAPPGFQTLLRHPIGRGPTRTQAIDDLVAHPEFIHRALMGEWSPEPRLEDFVERPAPRWTTWTPFSEGEDPASQETPRTSAHDPAALGRAPAHSGQH